MRGGWLPWLACAAAACSASPRPDGGFDAGPCGGCALSGCQNGDVPVAEGEANPRSPCQVCSPQASRTGWTDVLDGTACDAGAVCVSGACLAGCFVDGAYWPSGAIDPASGCLGCQPAAGTSTWTAAADGAACHDDGGTVCFGGGCVGFCELGGARVADGTLDGGNPDVCCNVAVDPTAWTPGFSAGAPAATALEPAALVAADVNGDGLADLAIAHPGLDLVGVLPGLGGGVFGAEQLFPVGVGPRALAVADFDGDGRPDLAVASGGSASIDVLIQQADGRFDEAPASPFAALGPGPTAIAAADLDGDGKVDLLVADQGRPDAGVNEIDVWLGRGDGTFAPPTPFPVGREPLALALADVDGDGALDVAVASGESATLSVLLGTGDGAFAEPPAAVLPSPGVPLAVVLSSFGGGPRPDLAVVVQSAGAGLLATFQNQAPAVPFAGAPTVFPVSPTASSIASADLDGDGTPDIAVLDQGAGVVTVFLARPADGGIGFAPPASYPAGRSPGALASADVNGDGRPDLVAADTGAGLAWILLGNCP